MSNISDYVEIPMNQGYFYWTTPTGVRFGDEATGGEVSLDGSQAIFSTGVSLSMVPSTVSDAFFKRMLKGSNAYESNGVFYANCAEEMQDLWIMIEDHWIQIRGRDLLSDISEAQDNTLCIVNFLPSVDNFWVFGNTIYKDYYVYHNPTENVMGWAPTKDLQKTPLKKARVPVDPISFSYDWAAV